MNPLDSISEKDFQESIVEFARAWHWSVWHISDARRQAGGKLVGDRMAAGLPDLLLVHRLHGFAFAELKRQKGSRLRPAQLRALTVMAEAASGAVLSGVKVRVHLWRPSDMDTIVIPLLRHGKGPLVYGFDLA